MNEQTNPKVLILQKITTEYVDTEDRIRLLAETANHEPVVLWLTQRLLRRLVPRLIDWLQGKADDPLNAGVRQSFAQQVAQAQLKPVSPVQLKPVETGPANDPPPQHHESLVTSVHCEWSPKHMVLRFDGQQTVKASLRLESIPLRQWLGILHRMYVKAEWEQGFWPEWIQTNQTHVLQPDNRMH